MMGGTESGLDPKPNPNITSSSWDGYQGDENNPTGNVPITIQTDTYTMLMDGFRQKPKPEVTIVDPVIIAEEPGYIPCFYSISSCLPSPSVTWPQSANGHNGCTVIPNTLPKAQVKKSQNIHPPAPRQIIHKINLEEDNPSNMKPLPDATTELILAEAEIKPIPPTRNKNIARVSPMPKILIANPEDTKNNNNAMVKPSGQVVPRQRRACCACECRKKSGAKVTADRTQNDISAGVVGNQNEVNNPEVANSNDSVTDSANCSTGNVNPVPDGFQGHLQLQARPPPPPTTASPVTMSRKRHQNQNSAMQQMNSDLLAAQLERKEKLRNAVQFNRSQLTKLNTEIAVLRGRLQPAPKMDRLKEMNQRLQIECDFMAREVDLYTNGDIPLGETSEQFYNEINRGQDANELLRNMHFPNAQSHNRRIPLTLDVNPAKNPSMTGRRPTGTRLPPPPRPPPPRFLPIPPQVDTSAGEWYCSMCTFKNHPDLSICEQCNMVRVKPPSSPIPPFL